MQPAVDATVPILLNAVRLRVLVVGGGPVGLRRAATFAAGGADVLLVAPRVVDNPPSVVAVRLERFTPGHLDGRNLAVAATDDPAVNAAVADACRHRGILCNRADAAGSGDFVVPAATSQGRVILAASTGTPALTTRLLDACRPELDRVARFADAVAAVRAAMPVDLPSAVRRRVLSDAASPAAADVFAETGADGLRLYLANLHPDVRPDLTEAW